MKGKALLVVDVQAGLFNKVMKVYESDRLFTNINNLIKYFHQSDDPVIFLRHTNQKMLSKGSSDWQVHPQLISVDKDIYIDKYKSNVFEEDSLIALLREMKISDIVIVGLVSHGCVKAATLGGVAQGLNVTFISDAHSNFNKRAKAIIGEINQEMRNHDLIICKTDEYLSQGL